MDFSYSESICYKTMPDLLLVVDLWFKIVADKCNHVLTQENKALWIVRNNHVVFLFVEVR